MREYSLRARIGALALGGAVLFVLSVIGFILWERTPYNTEHNPPRGVGWYGYTPSGLIGQILLWTLSAASVVLLCEASVAYMRENFEKRNRSLATVALILYASLAVLLMIIGLVALVAYATDVLGCGLVFCIDRKKYSTFPSLRGDTYNFGLGLMAFLTLFPMGAVMLIRSMSLFPLLARDDEASVSEPRRMKDIKFSIYSVMSTYSNRTWCGDTVRMVAIVAILLCFLFFTLYLPNDSRHFTTGHLVRYASRQTSNATDSETFARPELAFAWFRTKSVKLSQEWVLKLYPSNLFFYGYLILLVLGVWLMQRSKMLRYWGVRRAPFFPNLCFAELCYIVLTVTMSVAFFFYWVHDHNYKHYWKGNPSDKSYINAAERYGRAFGQLAILFLSLLLLPMSRSSILYDIVGVSRDSFLWIHRLLGYAMLAATAGHVVGFYVSYYEYGYLYHNLCYIPTIVGKKGVLNDFTVAVATWSTWVLAIAMGVFAFYKVRRMYYELFYYSHLVASYGFFPVMLWHASAGWMYLIPGLTLWFVDVLIRIFQRSALVSVVHTRMISDDVVEIGFVMDGESMPSFHPGHYIFVNIPQISTLQWHPYTLTNAVQPPTVNGGEGDSLSRRDVFLIHIQSMGDRTWSSQVCRHIASGRELSMGVEGPSGNVIDYDQYDDIFLVGGGIGAVPCISIYSSLLNRRHHASPKRVKFIWATRSASLVGAMTDLLHLPDPWKSLVSNSPVYSPNRSGADQPNCGAPCMFGDTTDEGNSEHTGGLFQCSIFVTRSDEHKLFVTCGRASPGVVEARESSQSQRGEQDSPEDGSSETVTLEIGDVSVKYGRPNLDTEISLASQGGSSPWPASKLSRTLIFLCGPETLVADTVRVGASLGIPVTQEEFLF